MPPGKFLLTHIFLSGTISFFLATTASLNKRALSALDEMRPVLTLEEKQLHLMRQKLTKMPAFPALLSSLFLLGFVFITEAIGGKPYQVEVLEGFLISSVGLRLIYLGSWWFFGTFIYHTIYQLWQVNKIYTHFTKINLYRKGPLYGLSRLTAFSAASLMVPPYGFLLISSSTINLSDPIILVFYAIITCIAIATFLWPQLGINRLQRREKAQLVDEANQRYEQLLAEFHHRVDQRAFDQLSSLDPGFSLIEAELKRLKGTSTWPWQPETLRWFISALVSPLLVWLIQFLLPRLLGR